MKRLKVTDSEIVAAVKATNNNRAAAARLLGVSASTIYTRLRKLLPDTVPSVRRGRRPRAKTALQGVWAAYATDHGNESLRNQLVEIFLPWCDLQVSKQLARLPQHVDHDLLLSAAHEGLIGAVERFEPTRGVKFTTYALRRVRGAMVDALRDRDHVSRLTRLRERTQQTQRQMIAQAMGRDATDDEVAKALGWTIEKLQAVRAVELTSLDAPRRVHHGKDHLTLAVILRDTSTQNRSQGDVTFDFLTRGLGIAEKLPLYLYFYLGYTMKEAGHIMRLSESRMSQIMSNSLEFLKKVRSRDECAGQRS